MKNDTSGDSNSFNNVSNRLNSNSVETEGKSSSELIIDSSLSDNTNIKSVVGDSFVHKTVD